MSRPRGRPDLDPLHIQRLRYLLPPMLGAAIFFPAVAIAVMIGSLSSSLGIFALVVLAILLFSGRARGAAKSFLTLPFKVLNWLALTAACLLAGNPVRVNQRLDVVKHFIQLTGSVRSGLKPLEHDISLGYRWFGNQYFGVLRSAGIPYGAFLEGILTTGEYGINLVRTIGRESSANGLRALILDSSGQLGKIRAEKSATYRIGVDTTVNPLVLDGVPTKAWASTLAMATANAMTLHIDDLGALAVFFLNIIEEMGTLRVGTISSWAEKIQDVAEQRRVPTLKANLKKLIAPHIRERPFTDDGLQLSSMIPRESGEIVHIAMDWLGREQKTFLITLMLGALPYVREVRESGPPLVVIVDELHNLLPEIQVMPYETRRIWEGLMYLLKTARQTVSLVLHSNVGWLAPYAYGLFPTVIVTTVTDYGEAQLLAQSLGLGREGAELLMTLLPQECLVRTIHRLGVTKFPMLQKVTEYEVLGFPEGLPVTGPVKPTTMLQRDFESGAYLAEKVLETIKFYAQVLPEQVTGNFPEILPEEIEGIINKLRADGYIVVTGQGLLELSQKGFQAIAEWDQRNIKHEVETEEVEKKIAEIDPALVKRLNRLRRSHRRHAHAEAIIEAEKLVKQVFNHLMPESKGKTVEAMFRDLGGAGLQPISADEISRLTHLVHRAKSGDLRLSDKDSRYAVELAEKALVALIQRFEELSRRTR